MSSIILNTQRIARFTSSSIYKLMGTPAPRKTYIEEKKLEMKLGRSINIEKHARSMDWGHLCERRVHELLDLSFESVGNKTIQHPGIKYHSGSPDSISRRLNVGAEVKCYEPKNFAQSVDAFTTNNIDIIKKECAAEYWQGVSNYELLRQTIMPEIKEFWWIFYMPYESELAEISSLAENWDDGDPWRYRFAFEAVQSGSIQELPYLPDGGYYKNLNVFKRQIPESDVTLLKNEIIKAGVELTF